VNTTGQQEHLGCAFQSSLRGDASIFAALITMKLAILILILTYNQLKQVKSVILGLQHCAPLSHEFINYGKLLWLRTVLKSLQIARRTGLYTLDVLRNLEVSRRYCRSSQELIHSGTSENKCAFSSHTEICCKNLARNGG
jgi:hypothetical protein